MPMLEWAFPATIEEALAALAEAGPGTRAVAGATALMTLIRRRLFRPERLVSLRGLEGALGGCAVDGRGRLHVGALARLRDLEVSPVLGGFAPAVVEALHRVANVRVRNVATAGGALCYGDPHLDLPGLWLALGGEAVARSAGGERRLPLASFFQGYYRTALRPDELLTEIVLPPKPPRSGAAYAKHCALSADDWPAVGASATISLDEQGRVAAAAVVVSAAVDRPTRIAEAEAALAGCDPSLGSFREAGALAASRVEPLDDLRGSARYKKDMVAVCVRRALLRAAAAAAEA